MKKTLAAALCLLLLAAAFLWLRHPGGEAEKGDEPAPSDPEVTELRAVLSEEELPSLGQYPNLRTADLSGSVCYDAMDAYAAAHPGLTLRYTLPLGARDCENLAGALRLEEGEYDYELLMAALRHLPELKELCLPRSELSNERLEAIRAARPALSLSVTRVWMGAEMDWMSTGLDLSAWDMDALRAELPRLSLFPALEELELTDAQGRCPFTLEDACEIRAAAPRARVHARFELFGQDVDTLQESLEYLDTPIGDEGLERIRLALGLMPDCRLLKLDDCGTGDESMDKLRRDCEGRVKVVWRVHFGLFSALTDTRIIHAVAAEHNTTINDEQCRVLRYCTETEYIDLGHNPLSSIEFCRSMPGLKLAILSYNEITDLSPLSECRELYCLELFSCRKLQDLSPLRGCSGLRMLNVSFSGVRDVTPVGELSGLELFHCARTSVPPEQIEALRERLPDCRITYEGDDIHEIGWRKLRQGEYYDWYLELREIMGYDRFEYSHK